MFVLTGVVSDICGDCLLYLCVIILYTCNVHKVMCIVYNVLCNVYNVSSVATFHRRVHQHALEAVSAYFL